MRVRAALTLGAALVWAAAGVGVAAAPASAAAGRCPQGDGVTVVVDYGSLGGGVRVACDPSGAGDAAGTVMERTGFDLDWVRTEPGFLCAINGRPDPDRSCQRTPPTDAYWALFWSDGASSWKYSTVGASGLEVPDGGSVGWRFQDGGSRDEPGASPTASSPTATPTPSPQPTPSRQPDPPGGSGGSGGSDGSGGRDGSGGGSDRGDGSAAGSGGPSSDSTPEQPSPSRHSPTPSPDPTQGALDSAPQESGSTDAPAATGSKQGGGKDRQHDRPPGPRERDRDRPASPEEDGTGESSVASADVTQPQASRPGTGDGVLTAVAMTSVVLLGAAAGVVGWRRRS